MLILFFHCFWILLLLDFVSSYETFFKVVGDINTKQISGMLAKDGGPVTFGMANSAMYIAKFDNRGSLEWMTRDPVTITSEGWSANEEEDGYIVTGGTTAYSPQTDLILWKVFKNGTFGWATYIGETSFAQGDDVKVCEDGGYIVVGLYSPSDSYALIVKFDSSGNTSWSKYVDAGVSKGTEGKGVVEIDDGYLVVGTVFNVGAGGFDILLVKYLFNGDLDWSMTIGNSDGEGGYAIAKLSQDTVVVVGTTNGFGSPGGNSVFYAKLNTTGHIFWGKLLGGGGDEFLDVGCVSAAKEEGGGFYIAGRTASPADDCSPGLPCAFFGKFSEDGEVEFVKYRGSPSGINHAKFAGEDGRGSIFVTGTMHGLGDGGVMDDILVSKVEMDGRDCNAGGWKDWIGYSELTIPAAEIITSFHALTNVDLGWTGEMIVPERATLSFTDTYLCEDCSRGTFGEFCHVSICHGIYSNETTPEEWGKLCSGHGTCLETCTCETNYEGVYCNVTKCFGKRNNETSSDKNNVCNNNGVCRAFNECVCFANYFGKECDVYSCGGGYSNETLCNGHGTCTTLNDGICECMEGWGPGGDCEERAFLSSSWSCYGGFIWCLVLSLTLFF